MARPPSATYRFQKMVRRNKLAFAAVGAVSVALVLGIAAASWQAIRATAAEREQKQSLQKAKAALGMLQEMFVSVDPWNGGSESRSDMRVRDLLEEMAKKLDRGAATNSPAAEAFMRILVGRTYLTLSRPHAAIPQLQRALEIRRKMHGNADERVAEVLDCLGMSYSNSGDVDSARAVHEESLKIRRKLYGERNRGIVFSQLQLAMLIDERSRDDEKERQLHDVIKAFRNLGETNSKVYSEAIIQLALTHRDQERLHESIDLLDTEIPSMRRNLGEGNLMALALALLVQGHNLVMAGETNRVESMYREALGIFYRKADPSTFFPGDCMWRLTEFLNRTGRHQEAEKVLLDHHKYLLADPGHTSNIEFKHLLRIVQFYRRHMPDKVAEFESQLADLNREAELEMRRRGSAWSPEELDVLGEYAELVFRGRRYSEAEPFHRHLFVNRKLRTDEERTMSAKASLARCLTDRAWMEHGANSNARISESENLRRAREAEQLLRECLAFREAETNSNRGRLGDVRSRLGGAVLAATVIDRSVTSEVRLTKFNEAESLLLSGQELMDQSTSLDGKYKRDGVERFIRLYESWPKPDKLAEWKQKLAAFGEAKAKQNKPAQP